MLPWLYRLYFWGVHGVFAEVVFTGIWEFVMTGNWKLMGVSSIWSFLIYGVGTFLVAELVHKSQLGKIPLLLRGVAYVFLTYFWEFTCGLVLDYFNARSWDYSAFDYNIWGLITLEYIPVWYFAGIYCEGIQTVMKSLEPSPLWKRKTT